MNYTGSRWLAQPTPLFHRPDNGTNETLRPWEAEGVSRAWWYRKRSRQIELFPRE